MDLVDGLFLKGSTYPDLLNFPNGLGRAENSFVCFHSPVLYGNSALQMELPLTSFLLYVRGPRRAIPINYEVAGAEIIQEVFIIYQN